MQKNILFITEAVPSLLPSSHSLIFSTSHDAVSNVFLFFLTLDTNLIYHLTVRTVD